MIAKTHCEPWNKGKKLPVEVLTADEVKALIQACSGRAPTGVRNRALLVVLYRVTVHTLDSNEGAGWWARWDWMAVVR